MMDQRFSKSYKDVRILRWNDGKEKNGVVVCIEIKQEMRCNSKLIKSNAPKIIVKEIYYYQLQSSEYPI